MIYIKRNFNLKKKIEFIFLTEPLIKFRLMNGKVIEKKINMVNLMVNIRVLLKKLHLLCTMRYEGKDIFNLLFEFSLKEITRGRT